MAMSQQEKTDYKRKFNKERYARIGLYLSPEEKESWQAEAVTRNVSLSEFIKQCVKGNMK